MMYNAMYRDDSTPAVCTVHTYPFSTSAALDVYVFCVYLGILSVPPYSSKYTKHNTCISPDTKNKLELKL